MSCYFKEKVYFKGCWWKWGKKIPSREVREVLPLGLMARIGHWHLCTCGDWSLVRNWRSPGAWLGFPDWVTSFVPRMSCCPTKSVSFLSVFWFCSWESQFLGRLMRSLGSLRRRKWSGVLQEEKSSNLFFFKHRADHCATKQLTLLKDMFCLKLCTDDYITTMYTAWGHVFPSWEPSD